MNCGIVGWGACTGNGGWNYELSRHCPWITKWLCPAHPKKAYHDPYVTGDPKVIKCKKSGDTAKYISFLENLDALLFIERPYIEGFDLLGHARHLGIKTIYCPMWEWHCTASPWTRNVDIIWYVTKHTEQYIEAMSPKKSWGDSKFYLPWGVDLDHFEFKLRTVCEKFLFVNGNGGVMLRKGSDTLFQAARYVPEIPILFLTQSLNYPPEIPRNVEVIHKEFPEKKDVYQEGDVFLAPSHWEGLAHQLYEAQACGIPVVTTDAPPMNECGTPFLTKTKSFRSVSLGRQRISSVDASANDLALTMQTLFGEHIEEESKWGRQRMEEKYNVVTICEELGSNIRSFL